MSAVVLYLKLFWTFFKIGLFTIGGGYAMIPLIEAEVVEKIKGRGLGDAQREIRDIYGVSDVKMDPSYPWVMTVPGDSNKVMITFEVKDQSGNEIKEKTSEDSGDKDDENDKSTDKE